MLEIFPTVVEIPVIIPLKPSTPVILVTFSYETFGNGTITCGGVRTLYPRPGLVIVTDVIIPAVIDAVAVAVVPIPIFLGEESFRSTDEPEYPLPPSLIVKDPIVPLEDTVAVIAAETGSAILSTIIPSTSDMIISDSFSS